MPKPPSHSRYQAVARSEPYPSSANRSGGGNNHGGGHGHSGRGSMGMMYHHAAETMNTTAGVTPGVPPPAHQQSAAPPNTGIGVGSGPGATGMMNAQYATATTTSTPRTILGNFGQQSSSSSSSSAYGQQQSFGSLQGPPNQPHNSSPSSQAPNFELTGYQHQQHHQSPMIVNQNAAHSHHPIQFPPPPQPQPQPQPQLQQQHQPPSQPHHHHQPLQVQATHPSQTPIPNPSAYNPRPNPPSPTLHNPTTSWTPHEDSLLLSSRASQLPWSELQRLHFPGKTANACRKRHERLVEKRQAEEEVDEDRLARIAGEYVRMREELWQGLAERMGMQVKEVEERCLGMGVGRLRVAGRRGGRRRSSYAVVGAGGSGPVSTVMPMMLGQAQGHGQGDAEEGRNYTHSPVHIGSITGAGQSLTGPGLGAGAGAGMVGPGHGMGMGMGIGGILPPQTAPPLTTLVPIPSTTTTTGHRYNVNTSALPTSSAPGIPPPPPPLLPLMQQQQQPRVAFAGYLNGRSSSRRPTHPLPLSSAPPSAPTSASASAPVSANPSGGYDQGQGQQWPRRQGGAANPAVSVSVGMGMGMGMGMRMTIPAAASTTGPPTSQTWEDNAYPPSSSG